eukprot:scaffold82806_cov21-Tisochrysis_lutea.AAC.1
MKWDKYKSSSLREIPPRRWASLLSAAVGSVFSCRRVGRGEQSAAPCSPPQTEKREGSTAAGPTVAGGAVGVTARQQKQNCPPSRPAPMSHSRIDARC